MSWTFGPMTLLRFDLDQQKLNVAPGKALGKQNLVKSSLATTEAANGGPVLPLRYQKYRICLHFVAEIRDGSMLIRLQSNSKLSCSSLKNKSRYNPLHRSLRCQPM